MAAGLALPLAFAPYGWWPLAVVSPAVLLLLLGPCTARQALGLGWCFGLGLFGHGVWWIQVSVHQFGLPSYLFSVPVTAVFILGMALYPALFAWLLKHAERYRAAPLLAAPALWVLVEYLRGWLFTGFPWLSLGYSQIDAPLAGFAPLLGVFGCSLAVMIQASLLAAMPRARLAEGALMLLAIVALAVLGRGLDKLEWTQVSGRPLTAALIQGAVPQAIKWQTEQRAASLELYQRLSAPHWNADVIIWPETAIAAFPHEVEPLTAALARRARESGVDLLIGMPSGEPWAGRYYNSLIDFGVTPGRYDKRHLVPFGEFFPFKDLVSGLAMLLHIPMSDFSAGARDQTSLEVAGHLAGVSICYEDAFGLETRDALPAAAFLVNVSNDAWFGDTIAPHQHLEIARMRALETGRYLLRATNTGITAIIDHRGRLTARAPQFVATSLDGSFLARSGATPYVRYGDAPLVFGAALLIALSLVGARRRGGAGP